MGVFEETNDKFRIHNHLMRHKKRIRDHLDSKDHQEKSLGFLYGKTGEESARKMNFKRRRMTLAMRQRMKKKPMDHAPVHPLLLKHHPRNTPKERVLGKRKRKSFKRKTPWISLSRGRGRWRR